MFNEKLQLDVLLLDDIIALHATNVYTKYFLSIPVRSKHPQEVWDTFCSALIGVLRQPKRIQMDEGGERKDEVGADLCSGCRIRPQYLRRNILARGV